MTGRQLAAARVLLGMSQGDLAALSSISVPTLKRMEASAGVVAGMPNNVQAVRRSLESAGVIFVAENGDGPGVRLRKATAETLTDRIEVLEAEVADMSSSDVPSPEAALQTMDKALAESELAGLKQKRKRLRKATPK